MGKYIYLNNFPSQDAVKGQEFKGDSDLEKTLLDRGVIGVGEPTVKAVDAKKVESLTAELEESNKKVESLTAELEKVSSEAVATIEDLKSLVLEAVRLKGKEPEGFKKYKG